MTTINLGGTEYELSTLNLNVIERLQDRWGFKIEEFKKEIDKRLDKESAKALKLMMWAMLADNYPEITEQEVGKHINVYNMEAHSKTIIEAMQGTGDKA